MKVFIGSSTEAEEHARWLAAQIEQFRHEALPWYTPGLFHPGDHILSSLERILRHVDAAAVVFSEDDKTWYRGESSTQPRDNVLIEYGLFAGALGINRVVICRAGTPKASSDLAGVIYIDISPSKRHRAILELQNWFEDIANEVGAIRGYSHEISIFEHVNRGEFLVEVESLLSRAKHVKMMGSGLSLLAHNPIVMTLLERARNGSCDVELYFADPFCPSVQDRLIEEELGDVRPQDRKVGLLGRIHMILSAWNSAGRPERFVVGLLRNYPTFALMVIDDVYYIYPYAYATLGTFSPVFRFSRVMPRHAPVIDFLDHHIKRSKESAIEATTALPVLANRDPFGLNLFSFAVFVIPEIGSSLYEFGCDIVGYDVRVGDVRAVAHPEEVGGADRFGFHLTVCDALYFFNSADLKRAVAEVEFWAAESRPFELTDLLVEKCFPNRKSISITAQDPSGSLEILHCELVHSVYRRAAATDYSRGGGYAKPGESAERSRYMIRHYGAPHILRDYFPHFSLLTNVQPDNIELRRDELSRSFRAGGRQRKLLLIAA